MSTPKGHIKETDILRGLRWVIDTHKRLNIRVVNISVGGDFVSNDPSHPLHKAIRKLTKAGVTVVVAAGNRNVDYLLPPASAPEAITVGASYPLAEAAAAMARLRRGTHGAAVVLEP